ncbi:MAG: cytochrome P450, partial [Ilumatobacteraceae bacterium]|nr:cytochrome P450 [Ilumatobacteraceae bacterium]
MQLFDVPLADIDLSAPEFWRGPRDFRESAFAKLRNEDPFRFFEEMELAIAPKGPGYIALTRHDDIWHVSRNSQLFCSGKGSNIIDLSQELNEFFGSMINMDDPKHFRLRSIVSKGFTPREISRIEEYVKVKARTIIDSVLDEFADKEFDFVDAVAAKFPLQIICEMMGIPAEDERQIFEWTNTILGAGDPDFGGSFEKLMEAAIGMFSYAQALGEARLAKPAEDLTSVMMHAVVDGERLTSQEFGSFFILLVVAGNETTRNAITHGILALTENPDQRKTWFDNFDTHTKTAVEEIVRWA